MPQGSCCGGPSKSKADSGIARLNGPPNEPIIPRLKMHGLGKRTGGLCMVHRVVAGRIQVGDNRKPCISDLICSPAGALPHLQSAVEACRAEITAAVFLLQSGETKYTVKIVSISVRVMAIHKTYEGWIELRRSNQLWIGTGTVSRIEITQLFIRSTSTSPVNLSSPLISHRTFRCEKVLKLYLGWLLRKNLYCVKCTQCVLSYWPEASGSWASWLWVNFSIMRWDITALSIKIVHKCLYFGKQLSTCSSMFRSVKNEMKCKTKRSHTVSL